MCIQSFWAFWVAPDHLLQRQGTSSLPCSNSERWCLSVDTLQLTVPHCLKKKKLWKSQPERALLWAYHMYGNCKAVMRVCCLLNCRELFSDFWCPQWIVDMKSSNCTVDDKLGHDSQNWEVTNLLQNQMNGKCRTHRDATLRKLKNEQVWPSTGSTLNFVVLVIQFQSVSSQFDIEHLNEFWLPALLPPPTPLASYKYSKSTLLNASVAWLYLRE